MRELIFKDEWDCIKEDGNQNYDKLFYDYRDNSEEYYKKRFEQQKEYFELNKDYILERRKRFDKALLFEFYDNDFSKVIEDMMVNNFIVNLNNTINFIGEYITDDVIERQIEDEFDKESLLVKMKYWFVTQSMLTDIIWRDKSKEYDVDKLDEYYKEAKRRADYIFNGANLFVGTNEEITKLIKERHSDYQSKEELEKDNVDEYWFNSEVFILRIVDNKVVYRA
jgi:hypothetical protein